MINGSGEDTCPLLISKIGFFFSFTYYKFIFPRSPSLFLNEFFNRREKKQHGESVREKHREKANTESERQAERREEE